MPRPNNEPQSWDENYQDLKRQSDELVRRIVDHDSSYQTRIDGLLASNGLPVSAQFEELILLAQELGVDKDPHPETIEPWNSEAKMTIFAILQGVNVRRERELRGKTTAARIGRMLDSVGGFFAY